MSIINNINEPLLVYEVDRPVQGFNHWRLLVNGHASVCPIQTIYAIPVNGEISFMKQPCSTECPLAHIFFDNGNLKYKTICGGTERTYDVIEKREEKIVRISPIIPAQ